MAYQSSSNTVISDARSGSFANVTIQNAGSLTVDFAHTFQGTVAGYASGGFIPGVGDYTNIIDKFSFAVDTNATDVGDLVEPRGVHAGHSSSSHGYVSGGFPPTSDMIQKFPFAVDSNASDVGNLTEAKNNVTGQSSAVSGYTSGGNPGPVNTIQKFSFAVDTNATDVGDLTQGRYGGTGQSSITHGYTSGGSLGPGQPETNVIDKFPFATDTNATDVGDLTQARQRGAGQSSTTHGYASGGQIPSPNTPPFVNTIDKFPFATDTNATDIADLSQARTNLSGVGQSSVTHGYTAGGETPGPANSNVIDKFPFSTDTNATDVGDLTVARNRMTGQQD